MRITLVMVAAAALVACSGAEDQVAGSGPDGGAMAQSETGGTGGTSAPATGGTGGGGTGGSGASGGVGGTGGSSPAPDAGTPKMDAMTSTDSKPTTIEPVACDSGTHMLHSYVCMDPPNTKNGKVLYKDGRPCDQCVTAKADGSVEKYFAGCLAPSAAICVMSCGECKPQ